MNSNLAIITRDVSACMEDTPPEHPDYEEIQARLRKSHVGGMITTDMLDCRQTAAAAPLWALVEAHRICKCRALNLIRSKVITDAMKHRFGLMPASQLPQPTPA